MINSEFVARVEQFVLRLNENLNKLESADRENSLKNAKATGDEMMIAMYSKPGFVYKVEAEFLKKYVRLWISSSLNGGGFNNRSCYGFIDITNGDLLKSASWKAPAKGVRGNIFADDYGLTGCGKYGMIYFR